MAMKAKPVSIYTINGEHVDDYPNISTAAEALDLNQGNLSSVLSGRYRQTKGYVVTEKSEKPTDLENLKEHVLKVPCIALDPNGDKYRFESLVEASVYVHPRNNMHSGGVRRSIISPLNAKKTFKGWVFFGIDDAPESLSDVVIAKRGRPHVSAA